MLLILLYMLCVKSHSSLLRSCYKKLTIRILSHHNKYTITSKHSTERIIRLIIYVTKWFYLFIVWPSNRVTYVTTIMFCVHCVGLLLVKTRYCFVKNGPALQKTALWSSDILRLSVGGCGMFSSLSSIYFFTPAI